jgi:hypothetical protein
MDPPPLLFKTLVEYMNHFGSLRTRDAVQDSPTPDLLAARFGLTGITSDDSFLAGITTTPDLLAGSRYVPHIRRDLDSVLGYSSDIPVLDAINYYPYPNLGRTLEKRLHLMYSVEVNHEVRFIPALTDMPLTTISGSPRTLGPFRMSNLRILATATRSACSSQG